MHRASAGTGAICARGDCKRQRGGMCSQSARIGPRDLEGARSRADDDNWVKCVVKRSEMCVTEINNNPESIMAKGNNSQRKEVKKKKKDKKKG